MEPRWSPETQTPGPLQRIQGIAGSPNWQNVPTFKELTKAHKRKLIYGNNLKPDTEMEMP